MRFSCGQCGKHYRIEESNIPAEGLESPCRGCDNQFLISANTSLTSTGGNSRIICDNCRELVVEGEKICPHCNLLLTTAHEELRIDNNYYESLDPHIPSPDNEEIEQQQDGRSKHKMLLGVVSCMFVVACAVFLFMKVIMKGDVETAGTINSLSPVSPKTVETNVMVLKSGETYYVDRIEKSGKTLHLTHMSGAENTVEEEEVLMITKGVIEMR